jgi:fructose-specific component phosphotransferase system IIB-like protein
MNKALKRHHENVQRQQDIELAIIITASIAISSVFVGFGVISAVMGV